MFLRQIIILMILSSAISVRAMEMDYEHSNKRLADSSWTQSKEKRYKASEKIRVYGNDGFILCDEAILFLFPAIFNQLQQGYISLNIATDDLMLIEELLIRLIDEFGYFKLEYDINHASETTFETWYHHLGHWFLTLNFYRLQSLENVFSVLQLPSLQTFINYSCTELGYFSQEELSEEVVNHFSAVL